MTVALIDDQALGAVLRGTTPRRLRRRQLATTGYWYVRLCQAVLTVVDRAGVLSASFEHLSSEHRERALTGILELPDDIELLSLRRLGPVIGRLRQRHSLNILGMEALASATVLEADVYLSAASPRLENALASEGRRSHRLS